MTIKAYQIRRILKQLIINKRNYPNVPRTLDGEIFLDEVKDVSGNTVGILTVSINNFLNLPDKREEYKGKKLKDLDKLTYNNLIAMDPEDTMGYHKYFKQWKKQGIIE